MVDLTGLDLCRHIEVAQIGGMTNKGSHAGDSHMHGVNIPIEDFAQEDRERTLELLLSQERVVTLLYSKVFPMGGGGKGVKGALDSMAPMDEDDDVGGSVGLLNAKTVGEDEVEA
jgi:hypothetical protein